MAATDQQLDALVDALVTLCGQERVRLSPQPVDSLPGGGTAEQRHAAAKVVRDTERAGRRSAVKDALKEIL